MRLLDNVIWNALTTRQANFAEAYGLACKFPAEVTSLGAFAEPTPEAYGSFAALLPIGGTVALFLDESPRLPAELTLAREVPLLQMVYENGTALTAPPASMSSASRSSGSAPAARGGAASGDGPSPNSRSHMPAALPDLLELTAVDAPEMLALAQLTKPGPFGPRTHELGTYLGIRREGKLAAMAGERLRVPGFTEVSAVCTHPNHLGHGYASALVTELVSRILRRGEIPFLHVRADNSRAIQIYRRLGFRDRHLFQLAVIRRSAK